MEYFNLKEEYEILIKNGWLTKDEAEMYYNKQAVTDAIYKSTSPVKSNIFNALKLTPVNKVKALILGKDPYPNPKDAHGLAFSSKNNTTPDSLKNIFKAIDKYKGSRLFENAQNDLSSWAKNGVLLLNTGLTFQKIDNDLKTQQKIQNENMKLWKPFVKAVLEKLLSLNNQKIVMLLWGNDAHNIVFSLIKDKNFKQYLHSREEIIIPGTQIMILQSSHPSPLSVNRGGDFPEIAPLHFQIADNYLTDNENSLWTL